MEPAPSIFHVTPDQVNDAPLDPVYAAQEPVELVTVSVAVVFSVKLPLVPVTVKV
jgi:hypothetical protein